MKIRWTVIPHGRKKAVRDLAPGTDPSNPPLTDEARRDAATLAETLAELHGRPDIIFVSTRIRAQQTAERAIELFGRHELDGCPVVAINLLGQPDSGDLDRSHPQADADGLVCYGQRTNDPQWLDWTRQARRLMIGMIGEMFEPPRPLQAWVFGHRPTAGAFRWLATNGPNQLPADGELKVLDPCLLPYLFFAESEVGGLRLIPR